MKTVSPYRTDALEGTALAEPLRRLREIYDHIEQSQAEWIAASPFRCPEGCGACCESFEPDILEVEAYFLAAWLLVNQKEQVPALQYDSDRKGCILADPDNPYHCTVYQGRPLVCRLFAYSGDRGKDDTVRYRPCKAMKGDYMKNRIGKSYSERELLDLFGTLPPVMGDLAGEAALLFPDRSGDRYPLREILPEALAKIQHLMDLAAFTKGRLNGNGNYDGDNDGGNDNGGAPLPQAS